MLAAWSEVVDQCKRRFVGYVEKGYVSALEGELLDGGGSDA
jgi:hypothetical protein